MFGAGFGIPYHGGMNALDLPAVAAAAAPALERLASDPRTAGAKRYLEMGRYLVGEAGLYLTRVTRIKRSRGSDIAICDGGMNHHLGACGPSRQRHPSQLPHLQGRQRARRRAAAL